MLHLHYIATTGIWPTWFNWASKSMQDIFKLQLWCLAWESMVHALLSTRSCYQNAKVCAAWIQHIQQMPGMFRQKGDALLEEADQMRRRHRWTTVVIILHYFWSLLIPKSTLMYALTKVVNWASGHHWSHVGQTAISLLLHSTALCEGVASHFWSTSYCFCLLIGSFQLMTWPISSPSKLFFLM